ncbi:glycoside hydrolase family 2 protein [Persicirhabdus sediminis]|nr:sugar-binding domain-containing protein [Persicirhabdus sediminis]
MMTIMASSIMAKGRLTMDLSGNGWKVWMDEDAKWQDDQIWLPNEVNLDSMPVNPPTGGWNVPAEQGKDAAVPGCVEEYYGGGVNTNRYHGVSWFTREFDVPADWQGKVVRLMVEKARLRCEIYVNGKLAAYDVMAEVPFDFEIEKHLKYGEKNQIAVRLTNPGGSRGWQDFPAIPWKPGMDWNFNDCKYHFPNTHDFAGIGHINLIANDKVRVNHVFVKNLLPAKANNIELMVNLGCKYPIWFAKRVNLTAEFIDPKTNEVLLTEKRIYSSETGNFDVSLFTSLPEAKQWSPDDPNLYLCRVTIEGKSFKDVHEQTFGLRTFEVKEAANRDHHYYLNGERFRMKSATDWGFYAFTGFYATPEMAKRSVENAKAIGHNAISHHRRIGEPLIYEYSDKLGLALHAEPGGFRDGNAWTDKINVERCRRMALRDRNHPSVMMYCLMNESNVWTPAREEALREINRIDPTRLIINTSGSQFPERGQTDYEKFHIKHIRPYETEIRDDYLDVHNAGNTGGRFPETDFFATTRMHVPDKPFFAGEVISSTGPRNWVETMEMRDRLPGPKRDGFDANIYVENHKKQVAGFTDWNLSEVGSRNIKTAGDISVQAGRGLMYMAGRHGQVSMVNDTSEGFAINGWSPGPMSYGMGWDWESALCDAARYLKGPAEDYAVWVRPAQIAIFRESDHLPENRVNEAKYLKPGETALFELNLINEGVIPAGEYTMKIKVLDGAGKDTGFSEVRKVSVEGGDRFAQGLDPLSVEISPNWRGGYLTVEAELLQGDQVFADGCEQVLVQNRASYSSQVKGKKGTVWGVPPAEDALKEAGATLLPLDAKEKLDYIVVGGVMPAKLAAKALDRVKNEGALMVVEFDGNWAKHLHDLGVLSEPVTEWGGTQTNKWYGNGWGYLDHFVGDLAYPGKTTISTNSWEVPADPVGFYPFASEHKLGVYGLHMARPWLSDQEPKDHDKSMRMPTLTVLLGSIEYGKGMILVNPAYHMKADNSFNDMLFFNMLEMGCEGNF